MSGHQRAAPLRTTARPPSTRTAASSWRRTSPAQPATSATSIRCLDCVERTLGSCAALARQKTTPPRPRGPRSPQAPRCDRRTRLRHRQAHDGIPALHPARTRKNPDPMGPHLRHLQPPQTLRPGGATPLHPRRFTNHPPEPQTLRISSGAKRSFETGSGQLALPPKTNPSNPWLKRTSTDGNSSSLCAPRRCFRP